MNTWMTFIQINPDQTGGFLAASAPFAAASLNEAGLVSFALLRQMNAPASFSLFEVYHDDQVRLLHLNSDHFKEWFRLIEPLLILPMLPQPFAPIYPPPEDWEHHLEV